MINIRRNVFETNSSSTHSICVTKSNKKVIIPKRIRINLADYEFGWSFDKFYTTEFKLAYIAIGIFSYANIDMASAQIKLLLNYLQDFGVENVHIEGFGVNLYAPSLNMDKVMYFDITDGYVDHANDLKDFIGALLNDKELLKRYLFSEESFIITGNDNEYEEEDMAIKVTYDHDEFYKGN
jgi:hypothetical protein